MRQSKDNKYIPMTSVASGEGEEVRDDVYYYTNQIVNIVFLGWPGGKWVLVDAGMPKNSESVLNAAEKRFGPGNTPQAIILTHGHFDHVGSVTGLIEKWNVPVFAHPLEFPYLTGEKDYPKPDTSVDGGLLAKISFMYPTKAIDISENLLPLPEDGSVPFLPEWRWIHTPGHSEGHVSYYRDSDRLLLSGDAFITVRQDSFYKVLFQKKEVNGPPVYLTTDWDAAWNSVKVLESFRPGTVISGHGQAMEGKDLAEGLKRLAEEFPMIAIPEKGKYVK